MTALGASLWSRRYGRATAGIVSLAFLVAFETFAVATVMPQIARELDGLPLYAMAFAAPMALSVLSLTLAGPWTDAHGPGAALTLGTVVFVVGLVLAGVAPAMSVFVLGRAVQGLGTGLVSVGLYVLIARVYPDEVRPRVFTVMTSAWVVSALVGPALAAIVADRAGWRWVFLGVPALALAAVALIRGASSTVPAGPACGGDAKCATGAADPDGARAPAGPDWVEGPADAAGPTASAEPRGPARKERTRWAAAAAVGVLAVSLAGQREVPGWPALLVVALGSVVVCGARLLPPRSWRGGHGLPSVIGVRGLLGAGFFAVEVYLPLTLVEHRGLSATHAGLVLTASAVAWFAGAWLAAHLHLLDDRLRRVRLGAALVAVGIAGFSATLVTAVPVGIAFAGWSVAGAGMGMAFSTLSASSFSTRLRAVRGRAAPRCTWVTRSPNRLSSQWGRWCSHRSSWSARLQASPSTPAWDWSPQWGP